MAEKERNRKERQKQLDELLERVKSAELEARGNDAFLAQRPVNSFTASEYRARFGLSKDATRQAMMRLVSKGRIRAIKIPAVDSAGRQVWVPGFQWNESDG